MLNKDGIFIDVEQDINSNNFSLRYCTTLACVNTTAAIKRVRLTFNHLSPDHNTYFYLFKDGSFTVTDTLGPLVSCDRSTREVLVRDNVGNNHLAAITETLSYLIGILEPLNHEEQGWINIATYDNLLGQSEKIYAELCGTQDLYEKSLNALMDAQLKIQKLENKINKLEEEVADLSNLYQLELPDGSESVQNQEEEDGELLTTEEAPSQ